MVVVWYRREVDRSTGIVSARRRLYGLGKSCSEVVRVRRASTGEGMLRVDEGGEFVVDSFGRTERGSNGLLERRSLELLLTRYCLRPASGVPSRSRDGAVVERVEARRCNGGRDSWLGLGLEAVSKGSVVTVR